MPPHPPTTLTSLPEIVIRRTCSIYEVAIAYVEVDSLKMVTGVRGVLDKHISSILFPFHEHEKIYCILYVFQDLQNSEALVPVELEMVIRQ